MTLVTDAKVEHLIALSSNVYKLVLAPSSFFPYKAGQYLKMGCIDEEPSLCFSIANAPLNSSTYELHLRYRQDNQSLMRLFQELKSTKRVLIKLPYGDCHIEALIPQKPILFIAGGTGFAPIKAMVEALFAEEVRKIKLVWCAKTPSDLYGDALIASWKKALSSFEYEAITSKNTAQQLVERLVTQHPNDFKNWQFVISGPFKMALSIKTQLEKQGVAASHLFSDAFHLPNNVKE